MADPQCAPSARYGQDELNCHRCGLTWALDEERPPCPKLQPELERFSFCTFETRDKARDWLLMQGFKATPAIGLGVWARESDGTEVRAFLSLGNSWTVEHHRKLNPDNFICE
jgi:hypothetical protein